jgi:hypothetical protein
LPHSVFIARTDPPEQIALKKRLHLEARLNYRHAAVKNLVEMPLDDYNALLAKCTVVDREYEILKNGLVTPFGDGNSQIVVVLCADAEAKLLFKLARRIHPKAVQRIRQYTALD